MPPSVVRRTVVEDHLHECHRGTPAQPRGPAVVERAGYGNPSPPLPLVRGNRRRTRPRTPRTAGGGDTDDSEASCAARGSRISGASIRTRHQLPRSTEPGRVRAGEGDARTAPRAGTTGGHRPRSPDPRAYGPVALLPSPPIGPPARTGIAAWHTIATATPAPRAERRQAPGGERTGSTTAPPEGPRGRPFAAGRPVHRAAAAEHRDVTSITQREGIPPDTRRKHAISRPARSRPVRTVTEAGRRAHGSYRSGPRPGALSDTGPGRPRACGTEYGGG